MPIVDEMIAAPPLAAKVLLVDDDPRSRVFLLRLLEDAEVTSVLAHDGKRAAETLLTEGEGAFDAVLYATESVPPECTAFLRAVRSSGDQTPIIVISGQDAVETRIQFLEEGGDDFIVKPFEPREFLVRLATIVRRNRALPVLRAGDVRVDLARRCVDRKGKRIWLSPKEFALLQLLIEARGGILSKVRLLKELWGFSSDPETSALSVLVTRLRKKVDEDGTSLIESVPNEGYRLAEQNTDGAHPVDAAIPAA